MGGGKRGKRERKGKGWRERGVRRREGSDEGREGKGTGERKRTGEER